MRSTLDLRALRTLLAVADRGSMTGAAVALGVTQSAISQIVQQIEKEVGTPLFDRRRRPLRLTASGAALTRRAEQIVGEAEQLVAATRSASTLPELRVGLIDSFAGTAGPQIARMLMERVRNLMLWTGLTARLSQDFLNRNIDLIVCAEEIENIDNLRQIPLFREPFILAMPKEAKVNAGDLTLEALSRALPMIRYSARSHTGMQIEQHFRRIGFRPPRRLEMDTSESLFAMVAEGVGWTITTPLCVLHGRPNLGQIRLAQLPGVEFSRQIVLVHRRGEYDELSDRVAELAWSVVDEQILPAIRRWAPWATRQIVVHGPANAERAARHSPKLVYHRGM